MKRYSPDVLERFLVEVDAALPSATSIVVIGGSALALGYGVQAHTNDIDTYESNVDVLTDAIAVARQRTGLDIPTASVAQLPDGFERRLRRILESLSKLEVFVADAYDLAASKLLRGNAHDQQQLVELHGLFTFEQDVLLERCEALFADTVGDTIEARWALAVLVETLWGEIAALDVRRRFKL